MKRFLAFALAFALTGCMYGNPPNHLGKFGNADITQIDWTTVDTEASACRYRWLFIIPTGNNTLPRAVEHGEIATIAYVNTDTIVLFPLFMAECTNVWGTRSDEARARELAIAEAREIRAAERAARRARTPAMSPVTDYDLL